MNVKKIEEFKSFVKEKPALIYYVKNNQMTWQKFYEIWDLYGPSNEVWDKYSILDQVNSSNANAVNDLVNMVKNINADSLQTSIAALQKGIGLFQQMLTKENEKPETQTNNNNQYRPRPLYQRFED